MQIVHDEKDFRFYADLGEDQAELTYTFTDNGSMDFDYTYVPESHRGQGLADKLVQSGLDHARSRNCKIIPSCPVVEAYVKRHPEYDDFIDWD